MAYDHQFEEVRVNFAAALTTAGTGNFAPGYQPRTVRAVSVVVTVAVTVAPEVLTVNFRPEGPGDVDNQVELGTITLPIGAAPGESYYLDGLEQMVSPGESVDITSSGASTAGDGIVQVSYTTSWETPANNLNLIDGS